MITLFLLVLPGVNIIMVDDDDEIDDQFLRCCYYARVHVSCFDTCLLVALGTN